MVKMTGHEWNRFYNDETAWPSGAWHEDETIKVDGKTVGDDFDLADVRATAEVSLSGGIVYFDNPLVVDYFDQTQHSPSLEAHFKHWRKRQNITSIVVEVANEKAEAVRSAIEAAGGKVVA